MLTTKKLSQYTQALKTYYTRVYNMVCIKVAFSVEAHHEEGRLEIMYWIIDPEGKAKGNTSSYNILELDNILAIEQKKGKQDGRE